MELLQLFDMSPVKRPCFAAVQERSENHCSVHFKLGRVPDAAMLQNFGAQPPKSLAGLLNSDIDLLVQGSVTGDCTAQVLEGGDI